MKRVDMAVIGTGPAGQKAAIQSAKLGKQVVICERFNVMGNACINTGTIPNKALREAAMFVVGRQANGAPLQAGRRKVTMDALICRSQLIIESEIGAVREQLLRNGIQVSVGHAKLTGPHSIEVGRGRRSETIEAENIVIACGSSPTRPAGVPFDGAKIIDCDDLLGLKELPKSMIVVGGGVIGTEYACMMAALGVQVILAESRKSLIEFLDAEIAEALYFQLRSMGITLRLGERVDQIELESSGEVKATLNSGKTLRADTLLYCVGRHGNTEKLGLESVGLVPDGRGQIKVNKEYQTAVSNIYAVGDVIGFPALASTSMEQGRLAACHAFGEHTKTSTDLFPLAVHAIPEISMVGKTESQLAADGIPYECGIAQFKDVARGKLLGEQVGMLKLLVHGHKRRILGVHAIGAEATELIHIGQTVMAYNGTVDFFINNAFNVPTLSECYKVAAVNANNKLRARVGSSTEHIEKKIIELKTANA